MSGSKELRALERALSSGRIDRREFLNRMGALGAGAALGLATRGAAAASAKQGGRLRVAIGHGSTSDSLDPSTFTDTYMQVVNSGLRNNLTEVDSNDELVAELAESWEASPKADVWTFKLRRGIEFHNGKTLDAADVVASINHHRGEDSKSAAKGIVDPIAEVRADGKETVVFTLQEGNADFPYIVSDYHLSICPSKGGEIDWRSGIGTGGYVLESFEPGVRTTLTGNPSYWKADHAHFDACVVLSITDVNSRTNALTTGEVDVMDRCDLKTVHLLEQNPDVRVEETSGTQHYSVPMRTDTPPFDNNDVRLALKHAVDREALLKAILRGHGYLGNDHPIGRPNRYHASELPQRAFDPERARFHLKRAGLSSLTVDLSAADAAFAGAVDAAVLYKEQAAKAGIIINVVREPSDGYWSNVWMNKPWSMCYWSGRATEDWMFSTAYAADAAWNDTFWKHERFNVLLREARAELDEGKRREMYLEMQSIVADEGGVVIPTFANYVFAVNRRVQHRGQLASNWDLDGNKLLERWWFA